MTLDREERRQEASDPGRSDGELDRGADAEAEACEDNDGSQKSYSTILDEEIEVALAELERPRIGLLLSGLSAGLDLGFSALLVGIVSTLGVGRSSSLTFELVVAGAYTVGFVLVILGRSELYTEHTTLAFLPVLGRRATLKQLGRLWGLVYSSNLVGAALFAALLAAVAPALGVVEPSAFGTLAERMLEHTWLVMFASGILAGWLMGLVSWLVTAGRDTTSEIFFVVLVTGSIGFAHLHHCILGSVELLTAMFMGQDVTWLEFGRFLSAATLGNTLGGVFFVALVKYGHATQVRRGGMWPLGDRHE